MTGRPAVPFPRGDPLVRAAGEPAAGEVLARRFTESALAEDGRLTSNTELRAWLAERRRAHAFGVTRVPFAELAGWRFDPGSGDLRHVSERFFTIEGLRVRTDATTWAQPIINQPEIGVLGIAVKEFDGILHCLMQAKMEPGYGNTVQLAPTVQATRSNYTRVHGGRRPHYLDLFRAPCDTLVDTLQSEQGAWFLRKRNRNMVVRVHGPVPVHEDFRWLTLGQVLAALREDDTVNMDARTVLSCIPFATPAAFPAAARDHHRSPAAVLRWLVELRSRRELVQRTIPCDAVEQWRRSGREISHLRHRYFSVLGVRVDAPSREITTWTQPLLRPVALGLVALVVRDVQGVPQLLVHGRVEAGLIDVAELAPTVQCIPANHGDRPPPFTRYVLSAGADRIHYDTIQSEEGGRLFRARNRYLIVEQDDRLGPPPPDYTWITLPEAMGLIAHGYHLNIQARSLVAALQSVLLHRVPSAPPVVPRPR